MAAIAGIQTRSPKRLIMAASAIAAIRGNMEKSTPMPAAMWQIPGEPCPARTIGKPGRYQCDGLFGVEEMGESDGEQGEGKVDTRNADTAFAGSKGQN